jgi:hypothetical protein
MTVTAIQTHQAGTLASLDSETMQHLVAGGDCSRLNPAQKVAYYQARCEAAGLDPRAQPFAFMRLNGKEVLYAQKAASDQLAAKHGVRMTIVSQATEDGIRIVTVRAEAKDGRVTEEIGALPVKGLTGEALSNALMKCVTKAKRRAILSLCGLGMLDETEVESIPQAAPVVEVLPAAGKVEAPPPAAAHVIDAKPEPPKRPGAPPPFVMALFNKVLADRKGNKKQAQEAFRVGAESVFGETPKPSNEWTIEDAEKVEAAIFPDNIPF